MNRALLFLPLLFVLGLMGILGASLLSGRDPAVIESALIGKRIPDFSLPPLQEGGKGLTRGDLIGAPAIVNVFASWCVTCKAEQETLLKISKEEDIRIFGFGYKDTAERLAAWLEENGNPFQAVGIDLTGRTAIEWGVYGVPETFIIDNKGIVLYRHVGVVTEDVYQKKFKPVLERL